jgi:glycosyltransferase involved in cell wall biosynthesis
MTAPTLSIVAPVYNEARILTDLVARCIRAAEQRGLPFELVIVDDASTDDTPVRLADLARDGRVRPCRLPANVGQFRATQAGLRNAHGLWVLVLDGDLQDPPEYIPRLIDALSAAAPSVVAVLAVKSRREDPLAVKLGQFVFHRLQSALSPVAMPRGAGSYCVMRREVARRVATAELGRANLAAVVAVAARAVGGTLATVSYEKGPRYDRSSRVGWRGLVAEALASLAATGALPRLLGLLAIGLAASGFMARGRPVARLTLFGLSAVAAAVSLGVGLRARQALAGVWAASGND